MSELRGFDLGHLCCSLRPKFYSSFAKFCKVFIHCQTVLSILFGLSIEMTVIGERPNSLSRFVPSFLLMLRRSSRSFHQVLSISSDWIATLIRRARPRTKERPNGITTIGENIKPVEVLVPLNSEASAFLGVSFSEFSASLPGIANPIMRMGRVINTWIQDVGSIRSLQSRIATLQRLLHHALNLWTSVLASCGTGFISLNASLPSHALLEEQLMIFRAPLSVL
mmetsp:Transcript_90930/g.111299  ORF Transcript_90930/g.111299 Transcript_90930/m.111299 type:complete len:224 (+) Transcript_90930:152-823(+)